MAEEETQPSGSKKLPKATYFILGFLFFSSFHTYFFKSIIMLFLRNKLDFTSAESTTIKQSSDMVRLMLTPIGALLIDSLGDKYIIMLIHGSRQVIMYLIVIPAAVPILKYAGRHLVLIHYVFQIATAIFTMPVLKPFQGNQFKLPEEMPALHKYYRILYVIHNAAAVLGFFISPIVKKSFPCLGQQDCYVLPFSISAVLAAIALIIFVFGTRFYIRTKAERNMALDIPRCITYGAYKSFLERKTNPQDHWLDHAKPKFDEQLVNDIKRLFSMTIIFSIIPLYRAVYNLFDSEWLFQATRLDGRVGSLTIMDEHFNLLNPLLAVIMLPILSRFCDPVLKRLNMDRAFRKMIFGGSMVTIAFFLSGFLETLVKQGEPILPQENELQVRIFNGFNCTAVVDSSILGKYIQISAYGSYTNCHVPIDGLESSKISVKGTCFSTAEDTLSLEAGKSIALYIKNDNGRATVLAHEQIVEKSSKGLPILTVLGANLEDSVIIRDSKNVEIAAEIKTGSIAGVSVIEGFDRVVEVLPESYILIVNGKKIYSFKMFLGGVYVMTIDKLTATFSVVTEPNSVHILWMLPQSILVIFGEVYFGITIEEFVYTEAPKSLKVLVNAFFLFGMSLGNTILVTIINYVTIDRDYKFYLFAALLCLDLVWTFVVGRRYKSTHEGVKLM